MSTFQKCVVVCVAAVVQLALSQQSTSRTPRIICEPPTLKLLKMVRPTISPDAKTIFGMVSLEVEIDKEGKPSSIKVLKGHPILAAAVLEAVRQWRWKPLKLNGVPVEAESTIMITFEPR